MSKGLEALEKIKDIDNILYEEYFKQLDIIEKELEALEFIRDKEVNVNHLVISDNLDMYNYGWGEYLCILTQEEFDLLKEIFDDENINSKKTR